MNIESIIIPYFIGNILITYIVYKCIGLFYDHNKLNSSVKFISFLVYYLIIAFVFLFFRNPTTSILANIFSLIIITCIYEINIKKSIISVALIYCLLAIIDLTSNLFVVRLTNHYSFSPESSFVSAFYVSIMLSLLVVTIIGRMKNLSEHKSIPNSYWLIITLGSISTFILFINSIRHVQNNMTILVLFIASLFINFFTIYLYDKIIEFMNLKIESNFLKQERKYQIYQMEMMNQDLSNVSNIRHDIKNMIIPLVNRTKLNDTEGIMEALQYILGSLDESKPISSTKNPIVDSILNYKLQNANDKNIKINTNLKQLPMLNILDMDLAIIIGNLVDNALENVIKTDDRWIDITMEYSIGVFRLVIHNSFNGEVLKSGETFISSKDGKDFSGIGLKSVKMLVEKYDGKIVFEYDNFVFKAALILILGEK